MSKDFEAFEHDVVCNLAALRKGEPDTTNAFASLAQAATATNVPDAKNKELRALAIGIAVHCDGCVTCHSRMAHQHGATLQEVIETMEFAIYMGGGPSAVYGGDALTA